MELMCVARLYASPQWRTTSALQLSTFVSGYPIDRSKLPRRGSPAQQLFVGERVTVTLAPKHCAFAGNVAVQFYRCGARQHPSSYSMI